MIFFSLLFFHILALKPTPPQDSFEDFGSDGPWSNFGVSGYAGLVTMNTFTRSSLFYWLFEAIDGNITTDSLPLIIWLDGGPGCSGAMGMIWQYISSIHLTPTGQPSRTPLNYTWSTNYHILMIDFPYGTGYSYANSIKDEKNSTQASTYYLWQFLNKLNSKYPSWFTRPVYIFGESYGGHWVPGLAYNILQQNALNLTGFTINLKGIGLADPWVDPLTQAVEYSKFGISTSLIDDYQEYIIRTYSNSISSLIGKGNFAQAHDQWSLLLQYFVQYAGNVNIYNMRLYQDYDFSDLSTFMNLESTKTMLNVPVSNPWIECNETVYDFYKSDMMNTTITMIQTVLNQGLSVLVYQGQDDVIVPYAGTEDMVYKLLWSGRSSFVSANQVQWAVDGNLAGYAQSGGNLTFVTVLKAGHLVQYNQPVNIKDMLLRFINGTGFY